MCERRPRGGRGGDELIEEMNGLKAKSREGGLNGLQKEEMIELETG